MKKYILTVMFLAILSFTNISILEASEKFNDVMDPQRVINNIAGVNVFNSANDAAQKLLDAGNKFYSFIFLASPLVLVGCFFIGVTALCMGLVFNISNWIRRGIWGMGGSVFGLMGITFLARKILG